MRNALAVLILAILMVSAIGPGEGQGDEEGEIIVKETRITEDNSSQLDPSIFGDYIVWTDWRNDDPNNPIDRNSDIYMYNLITENEVQLTSNQSTQRYPTIYGNKVIWTDQKDYGIYGYSIIDDQEVVFNSQEGIYVIMPKFHENIVVYSNYNRTRDYDIYGYNLMNNTEFPISVIPADQVNPNIWGDTVVWFDLRNGNADIYMYNLTERYETRITVDTHFQDYPSIWNDRVVWYDARYKTENATGDIYYYNLATHQEKRLTTETTSWGKPSIWGDNIVWTLSSWDIIYLYNIPTNTTYTFNVELAGWEVVIYENRIVFLSNKNSTGDIYLLEFTLPHPSESSFWEQNRMPIGLGITFIIMAIILVFLLRGKKARNRKENNK